MPSNASRVGYENLNEVKREDRFAAGADALLQRHTTWCSLMKGALKAMSGLQGAIKLPI